MNRGIDIERGLHGRCLKQVGEAEAERLRSSARERDRLRYARDHGIGTPATTGSVAEPTTPRRLIRDYFDSGNPIKRELANKQRAAAFTRKVIATRRRQGLQTSQLEERLATLLHQIEILRTQIRRDR